MKWSSLRCSPAETFSPVNDLSGDVYERLVSWVAGSDSVTEFEEEVEPETCPLDWVTITKDGVTRIELRRGMGCTTMTPNVDETYVAPYDYVTEEWTSATLKDWTSWREALDRELAGIETGVDGSAEGAAHLKNGCAARPHKYAARERQRVQRRIR